MGGEVRSAAGERRSSGSGGQKGQVRDTHGTRSYSPSENGVKNQLGIEGLEEGFGEDSRF